MIRSLGTCREWLGGSPALVKLERGGRTHLSRSSQPGPGYAPLPGESQAAKESQVGAHSARRSWSAGPGEGTWDTLGPGLRTHLPPSPRSSRAVDRAEQPFFRASSSSRCCCARGSRASLQGRMLRAPTAPQGRSFQSECSPPPPSLLLPPRSALAQPSSGLEAASFPSRNLARPGRSCP